MSHALGEGRAITEMKTKLFRWVTCGAIPVALLALSGCNGLSNGGPPDLVFSASSGAINAGQTVTLNWQSANAISVTITATAGSATRTVTTSSKATGSVTDSPTQTTTYTATAKGAHGTSAPQTVTVQVVGSALPTVTQFTAKPMYVSAGQSTTLTWATTNATSITITPAIPQTEDTGPLPTSGSFAGIPVASTTTYTLNASGPGGTSAPATVTVTVPFTLNFTASPSTITAGESATLAWQITGGTATSLSISDAAGNAICNPCTLPQGSATVTPGVTTTYTATAGVDANNSIQQSAAVTVAAASTGAIKHIFFMLQENRSFDNYFGQLAAYRAGRLQQFGITDTQTVDGFDPSVVLTNHNTGAKASPFHEPTVCTENLTPSWDESHHDVALNGGDNAWATKTTFAPGDFLMNNFMDTATEHVNYDPNGTRTLGYYNQSDLPYYYDLATFFATSDAWHSPILANTVPNRMYLMAATSFGHQYPDSDSNHPRYSAPTIFRAMNTANVSWIYYYKDGIFVQNFADYADPNIGPKTYPVSDLMNRLAGNCSGGPCDPDKALPEVIFIESASGASGLDEHPDNNLQSGAAYVQSIISALMSSDAWQDSVFILTYDEGGGLYDHVPPVSVPLPDAYAPGSCPDPNNGSYGYCLTGKLGGTFDLTGFRVPLMVISPYAKPNFVSHTPRDYTAILAFIEQTFNVKSLTARDAYWQDPSRSMSEFFDFSTPALLNAPNGKPWSQVLNSQPTTGTCDQTKEAGPTQ
ncbi:MAG: alkaline phosphatase family protein [Acidobacteriota bacterium]